MWNTSKPFLLLETTVILGLIAIFALFSYIALGLARILKTQDVITTSFIEVTDFISKIGSNKTSFNTEISGGKIIFMNGKGETETADFTDPVDMMKKIMEKAKQGFTSKDITPDKKLEDMTDAELEKEKLKEIKSENYERAAKIRSILIERHNKTQNK